MNPIAANRITWVIAVILATYLAFMYRTYQLQIVLADEHIARGDWRSESTITVNSPRGSILDREGHVLAESLSAVTLAFDPHRFFQYEAEHRAEVIDALLQYDGFTLEQFEQWAGSDINEIPQYHVLERRLPPDEVEEVVSTLRSVGVRSVIAVPGFRRVYPYLSIAGHTIGATQLVGAQGLSGIELAFNQHLSGSSVEYTVQRDFARRAYVIGDVPEISAAAGGDVILSLDIALQRFVEETLEQTVEHYEAESGIVIVSRPNTGEILAMASAPSFDPNRASTYPLSAYLNPAISNAYEPGSTAKIFTFASSMNEGLVDFDSPVDCEHGRVFVGGHWVEDTHHDDIIPAWQVIQTSSNVGTLRIGMRMDQIRHREYLVEFGFGIRPGSGLPGETTGLMRNLPWYEIEHANISFGHGFSISPLQLNMATAAIANRGMLMKPLLILGIRDSEGNLIETFEPQERRQVVSEYVAQRVTRAMETVVENHGTGTRAGIPGYRVAGKTGTAEVYNTTLRRYENAFLSSFTGFVPSGNPEFAITVMIYKPARWIGYYGGLVAAPLFRHVAREALSLYGIFPTESLSVEEEDPESELDPDLSPQNELVEDDVTAHEGGGALSSHSENESIIDELVVPDFSNMRLFEIYQRASELGFTVTIEGTGTLVRQNPEANTALTPGLSINLVFSEEESP